MYLRDLLIDSIGLEPTKLVYTFAAPDGTIPSLYATLVTDDWTPGSHQAIYLEWVRSRRTLSRSISRGGRGVKRSRLF